MGDQCPFPPPECPVLSGAWDIVAQRGQKGTGCQLQEYQEVKGKEESSYVKHEELK